MSPEPDALDVGDGDGPSVEPDAIPPAKPPQVEPWKVEGAEGLPDDVREGERPPDMREE